MGSFYGDYNGRVRWCAPAGPGHCGDAGLEEMPRSTLAEYPVNTMRFPAGDNQANQHLGMPPYMTARGNAPYYTGHGPHQYVQHSRPHMSYMPQSHQHPASFTHQQQGMNMGRAGMPGLEAAASTVDPAMFNELEQWLLQDAPSHGHTQATHGLTYNAIYQASNPTSTNLPKQPARQRNVSGRGRKSHSKSQQTHLRALESMMPPSCNSQYLETSAQRYQPYHPAAPRSEYSQSLQNVPFSSSAAAHQDFGSTVHKTVSPLTAISPPIFQRDFVPSPPSDHSTSSPFEGHGVGMPRMSYHNPQGVQSFPSSQLTVSPTSQCSPSIGVDQSVPRTPDLQQMPPSTVSEISPPVVPSPIYPDVSMHPESSQPFWTAVKRERDDSDNECRKRQRKDYGTIVIDDDDDDLQSNDFNSITLKSQADTPMPGLELVPSPERYIPSVDNDLRSVTRIPNEGVVHETVPDERGTSVSDQLVDSDIDSEISGHSITTFTEAETLLDGLEKLVRSRMAQNESAGQVQKVMYDVCNEVIAKVNAFGDSVTPDVQDLIEFRDSIDSGTSTAVR